MKSSTVKYLVSSRAGFQRRSCLASFAGNKSPYISQRSCNNLTLSYSNRRCFSDKPGAQSKKPAPTKVFSSFLWTNLPNSYRASLWGVPEKHWDKFEQYLNSNEAAHFQRGFFTRDILMIRNITKFPAIHYNIFLLRQEDPDFSLEMFLDGASYSIDVFFKALLLNDRDTLEEICTYPMGVVAKETARGLSSLGFDDFLLDSNVQVKDLIFEENSIRISVKCAEGILGFLPAFTFASRLKNGRSNYDWEVSGAFGVDWR